MLIRNWKMKYDEIKELNCTAPCSMYSVLYENKVIDDPFYGLNERKYRFLSDKDCTFSTEINVTEEMAEKDYAELIFYGLDTICDIYFNGKHLDSVKNMHRTYLYDVKKILKKGVNRIELEFKSPTQYFSKMEKKRHVHSSEYAITGAGHLRKTLCMSGWDWGPTLPDMGIFRPVRLNTYNIDRIENVEVLQYHKNGQARLEIKAQTKHGSDCRLYAEIDGKRTELKEGRGFIDIENPKLWWVRGYGEQYLYELTVRLEKDGEVIDCDNKKIGLRTLTVSTLPDENGSEFCFVINGVKIFAMGANYIPQDSLVTRTTPEKIEEKIKQAVDANFNCIRVWGGGYYPSDEFYDCCDRYGLIVWQDFLFGCMHVYLRDEFKNEIINEAECNVRRIRHHASLGMLCGNNEMECEIAPVDNITVKMDYIELFEHILADISEKYAPQTFYWCASPSSGGGFNEPNAKNRGDTHYWDVWHGGKPFSEYRRYNFRFCSEYGFESFPSIKTIKSFCEEKDMNCFSRVVDNHQKFNAGNAKIIGYLAENYLYPYSFENLVYASQLLQADAIKYGVEHFRRQRGYCMGSIYWQFNDCWPAVSWSSVDYYGRYKALHYAARKFYAPVAMGLFLEGDILTVNISNETMKDFKGKIKVYISKNNFEVQKEYIEAVDIERLSSKDVFAFEAITDNPYDSYIYVDLFDEKDNFIMRQIELLVPPKYFKWENPNINTEFKKAEDGVKITVTADCFAKGVYIDFDDIDCVLTDNFFNITNKEGYTVKAVARFDIEELEKRVTVKSVYDIPR